MDTLERLEHTITFTEGEFYTLRYSIASRIDRLENLIAEEKTFDQPNTIKLENLNDVLSDLRSIADKLSASFFEGGEADEK